MSNAPKKRRQSGTRARVAQHEAHKVPRSTNIIAMAAVAAFLVIGLIVLALVLFSGDDNHRPDGMAFNGTSLPTFTAGVDDPATGMKAPIFTTEYLDGEYAFIGGGGGPNDTAKLVVFVAHWCRVCQAELPEVANWVADNELPEGVEIVMVSTFEDPDRENHPPSAWFEAQEWQAPVALDSRDGEIAESFGMSGVPSWAVITDLNFVLERGTSPLTPTELDRLIGLAAASR